MAQSEELIASVFELYRRSMLGGLIAVQLALIVGLLVQMWRRRRAEQESRTNAARYRSVVDTQHELICRFLPDSTLTFVNDAYCRFWNKTRDDLLGRRFIDLIPQEARDSVLKPVANLRSGSMTHEHQVILPDGTTGWQHWTNHAILDDAGHVIELQGVGRDITDQKRAEESLNRFETRHSAILRALPDLMFVINADGTYLDYHARDLNALFVPPDVFIGRTVKEIMPSPLADRVMAAIRDALASRDPVVVEYELPIGDARRFFEARIVACGADRIVSIVRDLTEATRAHERNRDLAGRLIASQEVERRRLARELHDDLSQRAALLKIELDRLAGTIETTMRLAGSIETEIAASVKHIAQNAGALATDVNHFAHQLHPSRLQNVGLEKAIGSLCAEVVKQHHVAATFTHRSVPRSIDEDVSLCVYRVAQEALHNVVRHSSARQVSVALDGDSGGALTLRLVDDGVGFDPERAEGTGLGLVSMRERVTLLGGRLQIDSASGQGTRIVVAVPLRTVRDEASSAGFDQ
jgi:PAS domain S-box-containing protein